MCGAVACGPGDAPGGPDAASCAVAFVGDRSLAIELLPGVSVAGQFVELHDGDPLPLVTPPQGGHVSFVFVHARNVDPCRVHISAEVRSPRTSHIAAAESRDIVLAPRSDGWAEPDLSDISSAANVPLCPDYGDEPIVDTMYTLTVRLQDSRGLPSGGESQRTVVPSCLETSIYENALCRCECQADYTLGKCANPIEGGPAPSNTNHE